MNMKKKLFAAAAALALLCTAAPTVSAARSVPVQVDGCMLAAACYVEDGVTYVPLRSVLDAFGGWETSWDSATRSAVTVSATRSLQANPSENTVTVDGTVQSGRVTVENGRTYVPLRLLVEALDGEVCWDGYLGGAAVTSPDAVHDAVDLYWLSRIIYAESGAESLQGQLAVGTVILNRVDSDRFPDTIPAVVFDRKDAVQFEPVENGTLYKTPSDQSMEAAKAVLNGERVLSSALYFYAPALSNGTWIRQNCTYLQSIGCHAFYR